MGHNLEAIIGKAADIEPIADAWTQAHSIALPQGLGMIKLDNELDEAIHRALDKPGPEYADFHRLTPALIALLEAQSKNTRLAYIETDYFGGPGTQAAILFADGKPAQGPLKTEDAWDQENNAFVQTPEGERAINAVLKQLGVYRKGGLDEFDTIKLGWYG